jgi:hypothetical protein
MVKGHLKTKINTILNGEIDVVMIRMGKKSEFEILQYVEQVKKDNKKTYEGRKQEYFDIYNNAEDKSIIKEHYLQLKSKMKLNEIGRDATDENVEEDIKKYRDKYLSKKTDKDIVDELSDMNVNVIQMKRTFDAMTLKTLECVTRKPEDLTVRVFNSIDDIEEQLDEEELYRISELYNKHNTAEEEEIKNSPRPTSS